ncbi:hypothetical protein [Natrinema salinisoli]|uniref:hypothetical protein n=1 Tax=Natrinema salinisoli TaxID=2878535 RepID=UPI001CF0103C|nr:hypothetical protein [Natrinema salinisoli]
MSDRNLLLGIVTALEEQGLGRDEYQLHRVIDIEALEQLVDSAGTDLEVRFSVGASHCTPARRHRRAL